MKHPEFIIYIKPEGITYQYEGSKQNDLQAYKTMESRTVQLCRFYAISQK